MPISDAFALMPFTTVFALVLTISIVVLLALALPVRASAEATETGKAWSPGARFSIGFLGALAAGAGAAGFLGMLVSAFVESM